MDRLFAAARALVAALDRAGLAAKAPITRAIAARVLGEIGRAAPHDAELDEISDA